MIRRVENWSIEKIYKNRTIISFPEYQRQANLWSTERKALLIDSILKNIDIPILSFNKTKVGDYEVVDGQQRLWAIWQYLDDKYPLGFQGKDCYFKDLKKEQKESIKNYLLQISIMEDADDAYLRDLFIRLQLGLLLVPGEKLHAASGQMKDYVFEELAKCSFIEKLGIPKRRYAKETLCAQICINSFNRKENGDFSRTRYEDLEVFFNKYKYPQKKDLDEFKKNCKDILVVVHNLNEIFKDKAKELKNRSYILSIYLIYEELSFNQADFDLSKQAEFVNFTIELWKNLRTEMKAGIDRKNKELYAFENLLSSAPGEKYQIEKRHEKIKNYFIFYREHKKIPGS
ncbi:MAG: DUF262 domain-containing protein [Candidatus Aminicenantales bacterium]